MSTWKIACSAAILALGLVPAAHADEFSKLTLLTFSGPVDMPGIVLPAGTYRFQLADPETGRRVVKVTDKDGTKVYGMFLAMENQRMKASDKPVVMFNEATAGSPPSVRAWFYPGETYGYEFAYPHDQALKIARSTHQPVLSWSDRSDASTTEADRMTSMKSAETARIDENDKPVSADEALKESSEPRHPVTTTAEAPASTTTSTEPPVAATTPAATTIPEPTIAPAPATASATTTSTPVATSGTISAAPAPAATTATTAKPARKHLPRTGSELPLLALISSLSLAGGLGARLTRKSL